MTEVERFLSKQEFDFSSPEGWKELFAERSSIHGPAGRGADGLHIRDFKNYAIGVANIITNGSPVTVTATVRTLGSGLALPPGVIYFYHPDASWNYKVTSFYVGPPTSTLTFRFEAGGGSKQAWGSLYYIVLKSSEVPGRGAARMVAGQVLKEATRLVRSGTKLISRGEAGYWVRVQVGNLAETSERFLDQVLVTPEEWQKLKDFTRSMTQ